MVSAAYVAFSRAAHLTKLATAGMNLPARPATSTKFIRAACQLIPNLVNPLTTTVQPLVLNGVDCLRFTFGDLSKCNKTILYLHGGAYIIGNPRMASSLCARLSELTQTPVIGVDYRLAPEFPIPNCTNDVVSVYKELLQTVHPSKIAIAGDSAGGGLCLLAIQALRDAGLPLPNCAVAISPFADLTASGESHVTNAENDVMLGNNEELLKVVVDMCVGNVDIHNKRLANNDPGLPTFSPVNGSFANLPPLQVLVGSTEILLSDSEMVARNAIAENVDVTLDIIPDMCHSFPLFAPLFPEADVGIEKVATFINKHCAA
eukprot:TRINITY_DN4702_c4_g1_i1.p1 TRINITY_DN4702_c4_g1~~TRINITY_DN4702_c4_g1_i1.p1  ORF type:complete len:318 (+),score=37.88 TRINITY_DN4702_c4_g1_i1:39-992(+)